MTDFTQPLDNIELEAVAQIAMECSVGIPSITAHREFMYRFPNAAMSMLAMARAQIAKLDAIDAAARAWASARPLRKAVPR